MILKLKYIIEQSQLKLMQKGI